MPAPTENTTMPIYEYTCQKCNAKFEQLQRTMSGDTKAKCPDCGSTKTARSLSVFAVASDNSRPTSSPTPSCGRCGGSPGSCAM